MHRTVAALVLALGLSLTLAAAPAHAQIEDYADYQPQTRCAPVPKPGTEVLARWLVRNLGGSRGPLSRPCRSGGTSEHKEGRAVDWTLDAATKRGRAIAREFLDLAFAADKRGNEDAKARRMGIMYVIWNDHMWSAWDGFEKEDYLSSSCKKVSRCSKTLRHRDHMHLSLSRKGGKGLTSFYAGRIS